MLRKLKLKDAPAMLECMRDNLVNRHMNIDGSKMNIEDCKRFIRGSYRLQNSKHFAIVDEFDQWIGTISLKNINHLSKSAEYAIITSSKVHGKGFALNATQEIIKYGFGELGLSRIYLDVITENIRANKFYLKCGFQLEGTFRQAIFIKGKIYDLNWYSILKLE